jgi:hypothetical protein
MSKFALFLGYVGKQCIEQTQFTSLISFIFLCDVLACVQGIDRFHLPDMMAVKYT